MSLVDILQAPRIRASGTNCAIHLRYLGLSFWTHAAFIYLQVGDNQGLLSKRDKDESPAAAFRPSLKRQAASSSLKVSPPAPSRQKNETQMGHSGGEQLEVVTDATPFQPRTPLQVHSIVQDNLGKSPTDPSAPCSDHTKVRMVFIQQASVNYWFRQRN